MKIDPIIAVKDVVKSSEWYQEVFGWESKHGGDEFDVLIDQTGEVMLCLHKWGEHDHPTMQNSNLTIGNGLILYFRTKDLEKIHARLLAMNYRLEREIQLNQNSQQNEFSILDLDQYYLTISNFHTF